MEYLDYSLPTPAENLALDEALLIERVAVARKDGESQAVEVLRVWESSRQSDPGRRAARRAPAQSLATHEVPRHPA